MTKAETAEAVGQARTGAVLAVSCVGNLLVLVNFTAPLSTARTIGIHLGAGASGMTWILGSISLGLATCVLVMGSLADIHGRRRIFLLGSAGLALGAMLCASATDTAVFVLGRVVQGGASAAILAASLGLLGQIFPPGPERTRATGLWGAMIGAGIAIGPLLAGLLIRFSPWQVMYGVIALVSIAMTVWGAVVLPKGSTTQRQALDIAGMVTLGGGVALVVSGLTEGPAGWARPWVLGLLIAGLALVAVFVLVERHTRQPMLDLGLLRRPDFLAATVGAFITGLSIISLMTYVPIEAQRVLGLGPLASAGVLGIWSGLSFVVAPQARRLIGRIGSRHQVAMGLVVCGIGQLALIGIGDQSSWWRFVPGLALAGIGSGFVNAALAGMAVQSVPAHSAAMGSGANNTARYLGSSLGIAVMAALIAAAPHAETTARHYASGMSYAALVAAALAILGTILIALCRERRPSTAGGRKS